MLSGLYGCRRAACIVRAVDKVLEHYAGKPDDPAPEVSNPLMLSKLEHLYTPMEAETGDTLSSSSMYQSASAHQPTWIHRGRTPPESMGAPGSHPLSPRNPENEVTATHSAAVPSSCRSGASGDARALLAASADPASADMENSSENPQDITSDEMPALHHALAPAYATASASGSRRRRGGALDTSCLQNTPQTPSFS